MKNLFLVELPADKYGNRGYTNSVPCVIEAHETVENGLRHLDIIAPPEIVNKWPGIYRDSYGGWLEVPGPARLLSWEEREALICLVKSGG
jgi:hypothetical protein